MGQLQIMGDYTYLTIPGANMINLRTEIQTHGWNLWFQEQLNFFNGRTGSLPNPVGFATPSNGGEDIPTRLLELSQICNGCSKQHQHQQTNKHLVLFCFVLCFPLFFLPPKYASYPLPSFQYLSSPFIVESLLSSASSDIRLRTCPLSVIGWFNSI